MLMPRLAALALLFAATIAPAQKPEIAPVCDEPAPDGRLLGHFPYVDADPQDLAPAPRGFGIGQACLLHRVVLADLQALLTAAAREQFRLVAVSCHRSPARQAAVFHVGGRRGACVRAASRARFVGPPGYSEHATGYAIDLAARPSQRCRDLEPCFAATSAGTWLRANAPRYGFELSFPDGNAQGVAYEPWHWRWVGTRDDEAGAALARLIFVRARAQFPASPAVPELPAADQDAGGQH